MSSNQDYTKQASEYLDSTKKSLENNANKASDSLESQKNNLEESVKPTSEQSYGTQISKQAAQLKDQVYEGVENLKEQWNKK